MLNPLKSLLRGFGYPRGVEVILMISRPTTSNEVKMMSRLFDKVLIPASDSHDAILRSASLSSRSNTFSFVLEGLPDGWSLDDAIGVRPARWIVRDSLTAIAVEQPLTMNEMHCAQEGKSNVGHILMGAYAGAAERPNHVGQTEGSEMLITAPSGCGIICKGLRQQVGIWNSRPDFVILQDDETITDAIVSAARSDIRDRLFSDWSGLESY
jgi:hypothetical protein